VSNNPLYAPLDITKLPLASLYGTMRLLKDLHPGGLEGDVPMWQLKSWKEAQRRSKLPDADCDHCKYAWNKETITRLRHHFCGVNHFGGHCCKCLEWPGPKCALFERNGETR